MRARTELLKYLAEALQTAEQEGESCETKETRVTLKILIAQPWRWQRDIYEMQQTLMKAEKN